MTSDGRDVDWNQIIVVLHNLACCYQWMGSLEDCVSYLDGTIYNIESKITNFEDACADMMLMNNEDSE